MTFDKRLKALWKEGGGYNGCDNMESAIEEGWAVGVGMGIIYETTISGTSARLHRYYPPLTHPRVRRWSQMSGADAGL